jgi:Zn-dependent protease
VAISLESRRADRRPSPVFLGLVGLFALGGWMAWNGGSYGRVGAFVFVAAGWIVSLCLHEYGHAYLAWRGGDRAVPGRGYLTLNPMRYSDPLLSFGLPMLFVLLGGIGLPGGAVWVDNSAIRHRWQRSLVAAAGPLANVAFALLLALAVARLSGEGHLLFWGSVAFLTFLQVTAAVLNLLPVPGLDGFAVVEPYLPRAWVRQAAQVGPYGLILVIGLLWLPPVNAAFFTGVYALTDGLGLPRLLIMAGDALFRFWQG